MSSASSRKSSSSSSAALSEPETDDYQATRLGRGLQGDGAARRAIAVQKALRAPQGRRTSGRWEWRSSIRAVRRVGRSSGGRWTRGRTGQIGLIWQPDPRGQNEGDAITSYERAMAVDIQFMDLSERIHRLTAGRRE
jgi:hypothetical protein